MNAVEAQAALHALGQLVERVEAAAEKVVAAAATMEQSAKLNDRAALEMRRAANHMPSSVRMRF